MQAGFSKILSLKVIKSFGVEAHMAAYFLRLQVFLSVYNDSYAYFVLVIQKFFLWKW